MAVGGPTMVTASIFVPGAINSRRHALEQRTHIFSKFFLSSKHPKTLQENTSKSLDSFLCTKNTRYCFCTQSSFSWFNALDLGFSGVDVAIQLSSTPLTFHIFFLACFCSFCQNNMLYCFLQCAIIICCVAFFSVLLALCVSFAQIYVFMFFLPCFMLRSMLLHTYMCRFMCLGFLCHVLCLYLCPYMLIFLDLHAQGFMQCFLCFVPFFSLH